MVSDRAPQFQSISIHVWPYYSCYACKLQPVDLLVTIVDHEFNINAQSFIFGFCYHCFSGFQFQACPLWIGGFPGAWQAAAGLTNDQSGKEGLIYGLQ